MWLDMKCIFKTNRIELQGFNLLLMKLVNIVFMNANLENLVTLGQVVNHIQNIVTLMVGFQLVDVGVRVVGIHSGTSGEIDDHRSLGAIDVVQGGGGTRPGSAGKRPQKS